MKLPAFLIAATILVSDQITKGLALKFLSSGSIAVLPFFNLVLVWNRGISFGLFSGQSDYGPLVLTIISIIIIGFLLVWLTRVETRFLGIAVAAVIAGAIGNVIDRVRYGAVVDFLDFHAFGWHYPAFNIADSAIVLGIAFILFDSIFWEPKRRDHQETRDESTKPS